MFCISRFRNFRPPPPPPLRLSLSLSRARALSPPSLSATPPSRIGHVLSPALERCSAHGGARATDLDITRSRAERAIGSRDYSPTNRQLLDAAGARLRVGKRRGGRERTLHVTTRGDLSVSAAQAIRAAGHTHLSSVAEGAMCGWSVGHGGGRHLSSTA